VDLLGPEIRFRGPGKIGGLRPFLGLRPLLDLRPRSDSNLFPNDFSMECFSILKNTRNEGFLKGDIQEKLTSVVCMRW